jgi:hypothetical protein
MPSGSVVATGAAPESVEDQSRQYALLGMIQTAQRGASAQWWSKLAVLQGSRAHVAQPTAALGGARVLLHPKFTAICVPQALLPLPSQQRNAAPPAPLA